MILKRTCYEMSLRHALCAHKKGSRARYLSTSFFPWSINQYHQQKTKFFTTYFLFFFCWKKVHLKKNNNIKLVSVSYMFCEYSIHSYFRDTLKKKKKTTDYNSNLARIQKITYEKLEHTRSIQVSFSCKCRVKN